jgi:peroxiredoxin
MAQLRQQYEEFERRDVQVVVVGPEGPDEFREYWKKERLPFTGLPDPNHTVLKLFGQQVKLFKLGRMPAQLIIDGQGTARFVHYGHDMADIPSNEELFAILDELPPLDVLAGAVSQESPGE